MPPTWGGSCHPFNSLGASGPACLPLISPFSGLWHSAAAWGWGRRWHRCPVQVGSGLRCELSPGSGVPGTSSRSCPGDVRCAGPRPQHGEPAGGPQADATCTSFLGPPKRSPRRIPALSVLWGPGARDHGVSRSSSDTADGPSFLVLAAVVAPGAPWLGPPCPDLCLPASLLPGPQAWTWGPPLACAILSGPELVAFAKTLILDEVTV